MPRRSPSTTPTVGPRRSRSRPPPPRGQPPRRSSRSAASRWIPLPSRASFPADTGRSAIPESERVAVPLVQLTRSAPLAPAGPSPAPAPLPARKPSWLKVKAPGGPNYTHIKSMMRELGLHTVCEEARCPNIGECWEHKAATFMILGDVCTRNCTYCAVSHGTPKAFDPVEPVRLADAVATMGLEHVVITSVDRDDLPNGGAEAFAACVVEIRKRLPATSVEVLIPDF